MKLSILDQSPISSNQTAGDALTESLKLAEACDKFGYTRYWIAEHHDLPGLACSAPEVMLGLIGGKTKNIRIGCGAVLLPHYKPYKIAETYNMLATLFPDRVDIGIGRSPGGSAEATNALSDNFLQQVFKMADLVDELLHFLKNDFPEDHQFSKIKASPVPQKTPIPWMLGTSAKSAQLAAKNGLPYAFGQFMSDVDANLIIEEYCKTFKSNQFGEAPKVLLTVPVICAATGERAEEIAWSSIIWQILQNRGKGQRVPSIEEAKAIELTDKEKDHFNTVKQKMIIGNPQEVKNNLAELQAKYNVEEFMILTITHSPNERMESYKLLAEEILGY
ncbi:LLM class flavin-dependent oxidoreductase [Ureibacillus chungkukjangi]|uniref:Luciferase family oxidoreductase group 1 n=1 Tax=Ureibacillus chungkukjangi TaxID=1202712 RepID=A0A318TSL0_9BACL|nr:LLM class flavin-dependent oxidoreductase [Ureibacillus chungkukjangi]PYF07323.1 luciferase family oxidoreductase group 1 [Ureibacillus chungkukjangi]